MRVERRKYTEEFKREAGRLMETGDKPSLRLRVIWGSTTTIGIDGVGYMAARRKRIRMAAWVRWKRN